MLQAAGEGATRSEAAGGKRSSTLQPNADAMRRAVPSFGLCTPRSRREMVCTEHSAAAAKASRLVPRASRTSRTRDFSMAEAEGTRDFSICQRFFKETLGTVKGPSGMFPDRLRAALKRARKTQRKLASAVGRSESLISHWLSGTNEPSIDDLARVAAALGVPVAYLLGESKLAEETAEPASVLELRGEEYATLRVSLRASAGQPRFEPADDDDAIRLAFRRQWLQKFTSQIDDKHLYLAKVKGDSMSPTIRDGAMVLVQRWLGPTAEERERGGVGLEEGGIYLLQDDDGHTVKRVALVDHSILLYADNPRYRPRHLDLEDIDVRHVILGRVLWVGQEAE